MAGSSRGQSEVLEVVLLVGIVVIAVTLVGFFLLERQARQVETDRPSVAIDADLSSTRLTVVHRGGAEFRLVDLTVIVVADGTERRYQLDDPADRVSIEHDGDDEFEPGERVTLAHSFSSEVRIMVVDTSENGYLLYDERLVPGTTTPSATPTPTPTPTQSPDASFSYTPDQLDLGEEVSFDGAASSDPDGGSIQSYAWDFDGDGTTDATGAQVTHTYQESGTYDVTLTVTDDEGQTDSTTQSVTVEPTVVLATNAGGPEYTATSGITYQGDRSCAQPDGDAAEGYEDPGPVAGTDDDTLYYSECWEGGANDLNYTVPVSDGEYRVTMKFAEIYFDSADRRIFDVRVEGGTVAGNLDVWAAAGDDYTAYDVTTTVAVTDGTVDVDLLDDVENPKIGALLIERVGTNATVGSGPPAISSYTVGERRADTLVVSFDSNESLSSISVDVARAGDGTVTTLDSGDFTETASSGTYTYTATYAVPEPGTYTATLQTATDSDGTDGASGQSGQATVGGVAYEYYEGDFGGDGSYMPDFDSLTPESTGVADGFTLGHGEREDDFGYRYTAELYVPADGQYTFYTSSDDGSELFVDGARVVANGGDHAETEESGTVTLTAGVHNITVTYYENWGGEVLSAAWDGPGFAKQSIPETALLPRPPDDSTASGDVQHGIRYDGGLTTTGSNSAVQFDVTNVDGTSATVTAVSVESTIQDADAIWNGNQGREVEIAGGSQTGFANARGNSGKAYSTGTTITLDQQAILSTSGGGSSATVFVGQFGTNGWFFDQYDFGGLTKVTAGDDWELKVTLKLQSRGDVVYYFDES